MYIKPSYNNGSIVYVKFCVLISKKIIFKMKRKNIIGAMLLILLHFLNVFLKHTFTLNIVLF